MTIGVSTQPSSRTATFFNTSSTPTSIMTWVNTSSNTSLNVNTGYWVTQGSTQLTMTLPLTPTNGSLIIVQCIPSASAPSVTGVKIQSLSPNTISMGDEISVAGGFISTVFVGGAVSLVYNASMGSWEASDATGLFVVN